MDEHPHASDNALDLLIFTISDEELEKAAGGLTCAHTYPGTGVATICQGTTDEARRIAANVAKLSGLLRKLRPITTESPQ